MSVHAAGTSLLTFGDGSSVVSIPESVDITTGNIISVSANSNNVVYSLVSGIDGDVFDVTSTGQIIVRKQLDYETVKSYDVVVRATEESNPPKYAEKTLTVNVEDDNDNSPEFSVEKPFAKQMFYVDQFSPKGTVVNRV